MLLAALTLTVESEPHWTDYAIAGATIASTLILLGTAIYIGLQVSQAGKQVKETEKTRYAALAADLTRRWDEELVSNSRRLNSQRTHDDILEIVKATQGEHAANDYYTLQALPNFIEGIAAIEDEFGGLSLEFINRLWGGVILRAWGRWEATAVWVRSQPEAGAAYRNFQDLAARLSELRERQAKTHR